jgi:putative transposase
MPPSKKFIACFEEQRYYHVICKSIGHQQLFIDDNDRYDFIKKYQYFLSEFVDTLAYNLLDNHVHWIIKMKTSKEIFTLLSTFRNKDLTITQKKYLGGDCSFHELIEQQFHRLFISYTHSFNKVHDRRGHLFNRPFKRINVVDEEHLTRLFVYVHANSLKHGFYKDFSNYNWSSYQFIIGNKRTFLNKEDVLTRFGGIKGFIDSHITMSAAYHMHESAGE